MVEDEEEEEEGTRSSQYPIIRWAVRSLFGASLAGLGLELTHTHRCCNPPHTQGWFSPPVIETVRFLFCIIKSEKEGANECIILTGRLRYTHDIGLFVFAWRGATGGSCSAVDLHP